MKSPHLPTTQTSREYLESSLRVLDGICWGCDEPAGVKRQFRDEKVLLETPRSEGQKVNRILADSFALAWTGGDECTLNTCLLFPVALLTMESWPFALFF